MQKRNTSGDSGTPLGPYDGSDRPALLDRVLPPSTNGAYRGPLAAARILTVLGLLTIVPGCIHSFLPDGGASVIAGLDLSSCRRMIVALFAWAGATQIAFGIVLLVVSLRYRSLVPFALVVLGLERGLHLLHAWTPAELPRHHPPEHYALLLIVPLIAFTLLLALRDRAESS